MSKLEQLLAQPNEEELKEELRKSMEIMSDVNEMVDQMREAFTQELRSVRIERDIARNQCLQLKTSIDNLQMKCKQIQSESERKLEFAEKRYKSSLEAERKRNAYALQLLQSQRTVKYESLDIALEKSCKEFCF